MSNGDDPLADVMATTRPKTKAAVQAADTTIPQQPTPKEQDPLEGVFPDSGDPLSDIMGSQSKSSLLQQFRESRQRLADYYAAQPPQEPTFRERHPVLGFARDMIVETGKDVAASLRVAFHAGQPSDPMYGTRFTNYMLSLPPDQADEEIQRSLRGGALIVSTFASGGLSEVLPVISGPLEAAAARTILPGVVLKAPGPILGKWGSYLTGEMLGGSIYGALRPTEEDETRWQAITSDAAFFTGVGVGTKILGTAASTAFKKYIAKMPAAARATAMGAAKRDLDQIESVFGDGGTNLKRLPPDQADVIEAQVLSNAVREAEPTADIEGIARSEPAVRPEDAEPADKTFRRQLQQTKPLRVPRGLEAERPEGFIEGPGLPEPIERKTLEAEAPEPTPGWSLGKPDRGIDTMFQGRVDQAVYPILLNGKEAGYARVGVALDRDPTKLVLSWIGPREGGKSLSLGIKNVRAFLGQIIRDFPEVKTIEAERMAGVSSKGKPTFGRITTTDVPEYVTMPTVRGYSGKLYTGGATHPEVIAQAVDEGVDPSEFTGIHSEHPNRGFRTNHRGFVTRETAASLTHQGEPLYSENLHAAKMTPIESPTVAELQLMHTAESIVGRPRVPRPKGFEPTAAKAVQPEEQMEQLALMDAAIDYAVSKIEPRDISDAAVKAETATVQATLAKPIVATSSRDRVAQVVEKALTSDAPDADKIAVHELTDPTAADIAAEKTVSPHERMDMRRGKAGPKKAVVEVSAAEQVGAPWMEGEEQLTTPKEMGGIEAVAHMSDDDFIAFTEGALRVLRNQGGFITRKLILTGLGSYTSWLGWGPTGSPTGLGPNDLPDWSRLTLKAAGAFLLAAGLHERLAESAGKTKWLQDTAIRLFPEKYMQAGAGAEETQRLIGLLSEAQLKGMQYERVLRPEFGTPEAERAAMFVAEEGTAAPEFHSLTNKQQQAALALNQIEIQRGLILKQRGLLDLYLRNYIRNILPPESYNRWKSRGFEQVTVKDKQIMRPIVSIRRLEEWAKREGISGPIMTASRVHSLQVTEADRLLALSGYKDALEKKGVIHAMPGPNEPLEEGYRKINILGLDNKVAPIGVATALENLANIRSSRAELAKALDTIKSHWTQAIMFWWWEHGLNVLRGYLAVSMDPTKYRMGMQMWKRMDPMLKEMAGFGVNFGGTADLAARASDAWEQTLRKVGMPSLGRRMDAVHHWNNRILWGNIVPAFQAFTYATRMNEFVKRTGFAMGTPEYAAQARRVAEFANTVAGRFTGHLADPSLLRMMRITMFSPQWTLSRAAMWARAAGELSEGLNRNSLYLPLKLRQVAMASGLTIAGSLAWGHQLPSFNPNNYRFYMHTPLRDARGKEVGVDFLGWWQDELRAVGSPGTYVMNRLNPIIRLTEETLSGRDFLGREMTPAQNLGNIVESLGPLVSAGEAAARVTGLTGQGPITGGEVAQMARGMLATGNVATLPSPMDVALSRVAKKFIIRQGIPATDDNVFELSRLLRSNILQGREVIDGTVINWLASRRRSFLIGHTTGKPFEEMWQEARRVLADQ